MTGKRCNRKYNPPMHPWRARFTRWLGPLARRCPIPPNGVTLIALALNVVAAVCFDLGGRRAGLFLVGTLFVIVGGLADAFDGIVAREQGKETRFGDFLDHFADRVSDLLIAAGWMIGSGVQQELTLAALIAIMLNGYLGTQIEATWHERRYDALGRGEFVATLVLFPLVSYFVAVNGWSGRHVADWMTVVLLAFALLGIGQRIAQAARMEGR